MVKVYLDVRKEKDVKYVEDMYSSADIIRMSVEDFIEMIKSFGEEIHSCYSPFINHIGRFRRDIGADWFGEPIEIYARENAYGEGEYMRYYFNDRGQLINWPYGYFT